MHLLESFGTAGLGQILARSPLERLLASLGNGRFGPHAGRELLEPTFGHLKASRPVIKNVFWHHSETADLGPILAENFLKPNLGNLEPSRPET